MAQARAFGPESPQHILVIVGVRALGKSRLMWAIVTQFFDELREHTGANRWCDYFTSSDLLTEFDRSTLIRLKGCAYAFVDDLGSTDSFGRQRAQLQDAIRSRIYKNQWTFLTIDDVNFDPGLPDFLRGRAVVVRVSE